MTDFTEQEREEMRREALAEDEEYQYLSGLGAFVESYAMFESALFVYLQKSADLYGPIAVIAFGGLNVQQKQSAIRRVWRLTPPDPAIKLEVEEVFHRSLEITAVRNSMLHYGTVVRESGRVTSDVERALRESEGTTHRVDGNILKSMRLDILKCGGHLISLAIRPNAPLMERAESAPALGRDWCYTHHPTKE